MTRIRITLACAFCSQAVAFSLESFELKSKNGSLVRSSQICELKCPHCDSVFAIDLDTRRKRKGKRLRAIEAKREAEHQTKRAEAITRNAEIAARLLAEPGCTCASRQAEGSSRWDSYRFGERDRRLAEHGHLFSNTSVSYGIPNPPRHDGGCPCSRSAIEIAAQEIA